MTTPIGRCSLMFEISASFIPGAALSTWNSLKSCKSRLSNYESPSCFVNSSTTIFILSLKIFCLNLYAILEALGKSPLTVLPSLIEVISIGFFLMSDGRSLRVFIISMTRPLKSVVRFELFLDRMTDELSVI